MIGCFQNITRQNNWIRLTNLTYCENPANSFLKLPGGRLIAKEIPLFFMIFRSYFNAFVTAFFPGRIGKKR
jgi:hypothetical protein